MNLNNLKKTNTKEQNFIVGYIVIVILLFLGIISVKYKLKYNILKINKIFPDVDPKDIRLIIKKYRRPKDLLIEKLN